MNKNMVVEGGREKNGRSGVWVDVETCDLSLNRSSYHPVTLQWSQDRSPKYLPLSVPREPL